MLKLSEDLTNKYNSFMKEHLINGEFIYDDLLIDDNDEKLVEIAGKYRLLNYTANQTIIELMQITFTIFDHKKPTSFINDVEQELYEYLPYIKSNETDTIKIVVTSFYQAFKDVLEYQLDFDEEMKYLWRY